MATSLYISEDDAGRVCVHGFWINKIFALHNYILGLEASGKGLYFTKRMF